MILRLVLDVPADALVQKIMNVTRHPTVGVVIEQALRTYYATLFDTLDVPVIHVTEVVYASEP